MEDKTRTMTHRSFRKWARRRRELVFALAALALGALLVAWTLAGLVRDEHWGEPMTTRDPKPRGPVFDSLAPDFSALWDPAARNPFTDTGSPLESGGKARLPLPSLPPLAPEPPPAPLPPLADLFATEAAR